MTVTEQQQLEWLVNKYEKWPFNEIYVVMSGYEVGLTGGCYVITKEEWQQERDKLMKQQEAGQDNSWYERGELPPVGCVCMCTNSREPVEVLRHRVNNTGIPVAAVMNTKTFHLFWAHMFSPIKTEREKAIDEMRTISGVETGFWNSTLRPFAELLYDEGWRKQ